MGQWLFGVTTFRSNDMSTFNTRDDFNQSRGFNNTHAYTLCDAIKQKWIWTRGETLFNLDFTFSYALCLEQLRAMFYWKPRRNVSATSNYYLLYLKFNTGEIWLILLDHITYNIIHSQEKDNSSINLLTFILNNHSNKTCEIIPQFTKYKLNLLSNPPRYTTHNTLCSLRSNSRDLISGL